MQNDDRLSFHLYEHILILHSFVFYILYHKNDHHHDDTLPTYVFPIKQLDYKCLLILWHAWKLEFYNTSNATAARFEQKLLKNDP